MALCILSCLGANRISAPALRRGRRHTAPPLAAGQSAVRPARAEERLTARRPSSDKPPYHSRPGERPTVLVGHGDVNVALEEGEHGEPDASTSTLLVGPRVGQRVVVEEESGSDVERDEHVNRVVFVGGQDEEDAEEVQDPGQRVDEVPAARGVCL